MLCVLHSVSGTSGSSWCTWSTRRPRDEGETTTFIQKKSFQLEFHAKNIFGYTVDANLAGNSMCNTLSLHQGDGGELGLPGAVGEKVSWSISGLMCCFTSFEM